ncbi:unnamed protein product [Urochloa decumbens]|uniref:Response regulatory domain-containing protein n=1 Tax=Urochloa decumbens TaxID=240449 RepID=A0ABC9F0E7_9POAL
MDAEMVAMFPKGIRALLVDDDTKFVKSATMLLSVLNFDVVVCSTVTHALKSLTSGDLTGFDVILAHAAKAAACGFDFRGIVEADLLIPVIYFLPHDHQATGDEADELLSTLHSGTYTMKKPMDINDVRTLLWNVIAWHKCHLKTKANGGSTSGKRTAKEAGLDAGGGDEHRIHYKVVRARCGRKKKGCRESSSSSVVTGGYPMAKRKEKDNDTSQLQPTQWKQGRGKNPTLLMQSIPRTPNVPPTYNPKFFTSTIVPSYNPKFLFFSDAAKPKSNAAAPSATPPMYLSTPSSLPLAAHQQQQPSVRNALLGNIMSPAVATTTMAAATTAAYKHQQSAPNIGNQEQQDIPSLMTFRPFTYQGTPLSPVVQQDMVAPAPASGLFTSSMASIAAATELGAYKNEVSLSFLEAPIFGVEQHEGGEVAGMVGMGMYKSMADAPVALAPQNFSNTSKKAALLEALFSDDYDDCSGESSFTAALNQVLGMASNVIEPTTMNAFGNINAAPFVAPQVLNTEPNGGSNNNTASLMPSNVSEFKLTSGGEVAGMVGMGMYKSMADAPVALAPQNFSNTSKKAALLEALFSDDYDDCSGESSFTAALSQVLGMASNVIEPTTTNAFGNINAAPFVAPQVLNTEPNSGSNNNTASLMPSNVSEFKLTSGNSFASFMVPQGLGAVSNGGNNNAALSIVHQGLDTAPIGGGNNVTPFMAPRQDLGVAPNGESSNATPFVVPHQDLNAALNGDQLVLVNEINYALLGSQGDGLVKAMEGDNASNTASIVLPSEKYEHNTLFPLEALLGDLHGPIFEFDDIDLDDLVSGSISSGATAADAAGTSFVGDGNIDDSAISSLDGLEIPEGLFAEYGNNICG